MTDWVPLMTVMVSKLSTLAYVEPTSIFVEQPPYIIAPPIKVFSLWSLCPLMTGSKPCPPFLIDWMPFID